MAANERNKGQDFDRLLLELLADRWTILVLGAICGADDSRIRFNALRREVPDITQKSLTQCLRRLERNGLIERHLVDSAPPGVEYSVTPLSRTLEKPFDALIAWTREHADSVRRAQAVYDKKMGSEAAS